MSRHLLFALALLAASTAQAADIPPMPATAEIVPVAALASATPATVAAELGAPASCEASKYGQRCYYLDGAVEVVFIGGLADWITVYPADAFLTPSSLSQLGLPGNLKPSADSGDMIRWEGQQGLREVAAYAGEGGRVSYFHVKATTP